MALLEGTAQTAPESTPVWQAGLEPIPGYRLLEPLGRGGFGEVWKCEAPGGLVKALKIVRGDGLEASQEHTSLQRVKGIRHPFILSLERVEVHADGLLVVMELADRNLLDRHREVRELGLNGIPRRELLGLLLEAAEALDWMSFAHGLQHLDIKPQNLFLVSNHLKVADFGLVGKVQPDGSSERHHGSLTPLYASPELGRGVVSRQSDQYSLAVVYQYMLTGVPPFQAGHPRELLLAHLNDPPNLEPLPEEDRAAVARALSKDPAQRFPSCLAFLQALVCGVEPEEVDADALPLPLPQRFSVAAGAAATPAPAKKMSLAAATPTLMAVSGYRFLEPMGHSLGEELWRVRDAEGQEYRALCLSGSVGTDDALPARLQALNHPLLPATHVFRGPSDRVCVVMHCCEGSLADRFDECRAAGLGGIPRSELLAHMQSVAEALDAATRERNLPHLGLHPRNLLLDKGRVWVADFGVVAAALRPAGRLPIQVNPRYAAPELADDRPMARSDQYALALIYAELLTGIHPRGRSAAPAAAVNPLHARVGPRAPSGRPSARVNLDLLAASDRAVLARALDPDPHRRYASCSALFDALEMADGKNLAKKAGVIGLPTLLPFPDARGQMPDRTTLPRLPQIVAELADDRSHNAEPVARGLGGVSMQLKRGWRAKFPVRPVPGATVLKLRGFAEHWGGRLVQEDESDFTLVLETLPEQLRDGPFSARRGLEIHLHLCGAEHASMGLSEVRVTFRPWPDPAREAEEWLERVGPCLLTSLRSYLQALSERRGGERWPCPHPVHIYPVLAGSKLGRALTGVCRDISHNGVSFLAPEALAAPQVYLQWYKTPKLTQVAVLVELLRVRQVSDDSYEIAGLLPLST